MQGLGVKRPRSPDGLGSCCGGERRAKSGRRGGRNRGNGGGGGGGNEDNNNNNNSTRAPGATYPRHRVWNQFGAGNAAAFSREKVVLYLKNLPEVIDDQWEQNEAITQLLLQAFRDAIEGPEAVIDLTRLGAPPSCNRVLGNADAGQLFEALHAARQGLLTSSSSFGNQLALVKQCLPVNQGHMLDRLRTLAPDETANSSGWLWEFLRSAVRNFMDVRVRHMNKQAGYNEDGLPWDENRRNRITEPDNMPEYVEMTNGFVHGGDLRFDALMSELGFGNARYGQGYDNYLRALFRRMYGMTSATAIWLCKLCSSTAPRLVPP